MSNINSVMKESRVFILKGNIIGMAVGIIIGGAFSKIVTPLVDDILVLLLGALTGGASFNTPKYVIRPTATVNGVEVAEVAILYGNFLQNVSGLLTTGVCMSFMTRTAAAVSSRLHHEEKAKEEVPAPAGPTREGLLAEIRDLLKERGNIT